MARSRSFWRDLSLRAVVAGFVAVLVGHGGSVVIAFRAAAALLAGVGAAFRGVVAGRRRWRCSARAADRHPVPQRWRRVVTQSRAFVRSPLP